MTPLATRKSHLMGRCDFFQSLFERGILLAQKGRSLSSDGNKMETNIGEKMNCEGRRRRGMNE
jgi:hypothetical protein